MPLLRLLLTLATGLLGALLFAVLQLPIPWLLGSMFSSALAMRLAVPMAPIPEFPERVMRVVIGVTLGPAVAASVNSNAADLPWAAVAAIVVTLLTAGIGMRWFEWRAGLSRPSAFLASLPGGLSVLFGLSNSLDDRPRILLAHTVRVVIVVVFISLLARVLGVTTVDAPLSAGLNWRSEAAPLVLLALVVVNFALAEYLRVAGGHVIIPMLVTAVIAASTSIPVDSPELLQSIAMLVFGTVLGMQLGAAPGQENRVLVLTAISFSFFAIALVAVVALSVAAVSSQTFLVLFLALAPGGIAEVSLVALALGLDAGLVALLHSCRFLLIVFIGPFASNWLTRSRSR